MMRGFFVSLMCLFSITSFSFSCGNALPTDDVGFCASFKAVATCYCTSSGVPSGMCQNMKTLYDRMMSVYGSLDNACSKQKYTPKQDCLDNWNCYRLGGRDSKNRLCSSTAQACKQQ